MTKFSIFIIELCKNIIEDDIISKAGDLTFKILLSLFPFIMFLMALSSYFEIDAMLLIDGMYQGLPPDIMDFIAPFMIELFEIRRPSILSISFIVMVFSASGGFNTAMKGINKAHGQIDERNFFHRRIISIALVFVFAIAIVSALIMLIFNNTIYNFAINHLYDTAFLNAFFSFFGYLISVGILLLSVLIINTLSLARKKRFRDLLPGACTTVVCWVILSRVFSIYVNNFSNHSALYGSVAGIMLFMIWLNLTCVFMLVGAEINALVSVKR
ncbi:MAG: YihY/virulence factor BrkB family protein [Defluviitaleaceae bacterium]|nr:YihY/virulence factor BrkB family protein [Defluviitaleaceae bacterium]